MAICSNGGVLGAPAVYCTTCVGLRAKIRQNTLFLSLITGRHCLAACLTMILRMTTHITRFVNFQLSNEAEGLFGGEKMMTSYIFLFTTNFVALNFIISRCWLFKACMR